MSKIKVELEDIGEGWNGDYDPDPDADADDTCDEPLLRFTFYKLCRGEWVPIDDASCCTRLSANLSADTKRKLSEWLLDHFDQEHPKKCCEQLSWVTLRDIGEGGGENV